MAVQNILRLPDVEKATGLKKSAIYQEMAEGRFPRPMQLTAQAVGWPENDIAAWQQARERATGGRAPRARKRRTSASVSTAGVAS